MVENSLNQEASQRSEAQKPNSNPTYGQSSNQETQTATERHSWLSWGCAAWETGANKVRLFLWFTLCWSDYIVVISCDLSCFFVLLSNCIQYIVAFACDWTLGRLPRAKIRQKSVFFVDKSVQWYNAVVWSKHLMLCVASAVCMCMRCLKCWETELIHLLYDDIKLWINTVLDILLICF